MEYQEVRFKVPEFSNWQCSIAGTTYRPLKGTEPSAFHRWMHKVLLGVEWERVDG